jgi:hypothetical protein
VVYAVLEAAEIPVSKTDDWAVTLIDKDGTPEVLIFPEEGIKKGLLFRFQFHYEVPVHYFWNPEMCPGYKPPPPPVIH